MTDRKQATDAQGASNKNIAVVHRIPSWEEFIQARLCILLDEKESNGYFSKCW